MKTNDPDIDYGELRSFDLKRFLQKYSEKDIMAVQSKYGNLGKILCGQIVLHKKALGKTPLFANNYCFFTRKSLEQASSEKLAEFKAGLFSGDKMVDLTGGLGIDDAEFAGSFKQVISIDIDAELNKLSRINFEKLSISNIVRIDADAYEFIKSDDTYDLIYIDADRRKGGKKNILFTDSEPDILKIIGRLIETSNTVLLKLSPLTDLTYIEKRLKNIKNIIIAALNNEVKETLVVIQSGFGGAIKVTAADLHSDGKLKEFSADFKQKATPLQSETGKYFYEPSVSIIKAGLTAPYAELINLNLISRNGVYMTGDRLVNNFMGRAFEIKEVINYGKSAVKKYLKANNIPKANVSSRNFPVKAEEIKKTFNIKDGGDDYLFFTAGKQKLMYHCRKVNQY